MEFSDTSDHPERLIYYISMLIMPLILLPIWIYCYRVVFHIHKNSIWVKRRDKPLIRWSFIFVFFHTFIYTPITWSLVEFPPYHIHYETAVFFQTNICIAFGVLQLVRVWLYGTLYT